MRIDYLWCKLNLKQKQHQTINTSGMSDLGPNWTFSHQVSEHFDAKKSPICPIWGLSDKFLAQIWHLWNSWWKMSEINHKSHSYRLKFLSKDRQGQSVDLSRTICKTSLDVSVANVKLTRHNFDYKIDVQSMKVWYWYYYDMYMNELWKIIED